MVVGNKEMVGQMISFVECKAKVSINASWKRHHAANDPKDPPESTAVYAVIEVSDKLRTYRLIARRTDGDGNIHDSLFEHLGGIEGEAEERPQLLGILVVRFGDFGSHLLGSLRPRLVHGTAGH